MPTPIVLNGNPLAKYSDQALADMGAGGLHPGAPSFDAYALSMDQARLANSMQQSTRAGAEAGVARAITKAGESGYLGSLQLGEQATVDGRR